MHPLYCKLNALLYKLKILNFHLRLISLMKIFKTLKGNYIARKRKSQLGNSKCGQTILGGVHSGSRELGGGKWTGGKKKERNGNETRMMIRRWGGGEESCLEKCLEQNFGICGLYLPIFGDGP